MTFKSIAHEIGHNLGLRHDFVEVNGAYKTERFCEAGESCTDVGGVMDYYVVSIVEFSLLAFFELS